MFENDVLRVFLSNCVAFLNLCLLVYSYLMKSKKDMVTLNVISEGLMLAVYVISGFWTAAVTNLFSFGRDMYYTKSAKKSKMAVALILLVGVIITVVVNLGETKEQFLLLPVISLLLYSGGLFLCKSANQLKLVSAVDISLWFFYDFRNMLILCVVQDFFIILMSLASLYVELDTEEESIDVQR